MIVKRVICIIVAVLVPFYAYATVDRYEVNSDSNGIYYVGNTSYKKTCEMYSEYEVLPLPIIVQTAYDAMRIADANMAMLLRGSINMERLQGYRMCGIEFEPTNNLWTVSYTDDLYNPNHYVSVVVNGNDGGVTGDIYKEYHDSHLIQNTQIIEPAQAAQIASVILESEKQYGHLLNYQVYSIEYDSDAKVWIVMLAKQTHDVENYLVSFSGEVLIAISAVDGHILNIWNFIF